MLRQKGVRFWLGLLLLGLVVLVTLQNVETVQVSFLLWSVELPRAVLLVVIFAAGAAVGWLFGRLRNRE